MTTFSSPSPLLQSRRSLHPSVSTAGKCFFLVLVSTFLALGRNIQVTLFVTHPQQLTSNWLWLPPLSSSHDFQRILSEDNPSLYYHFAYHEEESFSRERILYREGDPEVLLTLSGLIQRADDIIQDAGPVVVEEPWKRLLRKKKHSNTTRSLVINTPRTIISPAQVASMQSNVTILGLAYFITGSFHYAELSVQLLQKWFLEPYTRISAQDLFASPLHIQIFQFLDAVQMVQAHLDDDAVVQINEWFSGYHKHIQRRNEIQQSTYLDSLQYDAQDLALAHFLKDEARQAEVWKRTLAKLSDEIPLQQERCEHYQMVTLQEWWTLARLLNNILGETLWTAQDGALCKASESSIPFLKYRARCGTVVEDDTRWFPVLVDSLRHCVSLPTKKITWREWMSPNSQQVPTNLYAMPTTNFPVDTGIVPYWNLGMAIWKTQGMHPEGSKFARMEKEKGSLYIPSKLQKAAEQSIEFQQRLQRIKRWHALGQKDISQRMMKRALKDLRSTKVLWQPKDFIPQAMLEAGKSDPLMMERVSRIRRWHALKQTAIVDRMITKSMEDLRRKVDDDQEVDELSKQYEETKEARDQQPTFLQTQRESDNGVNGFFMRKSKQDARTPLSVAEASSFSRKASSIDIPFTLLEQAKSDPEMAKRIYRIQRWKKLGQHEIAEKMIKKMMASTEDQLF